MDRLTKDVHKAPTTNTCSVENQAELFFVHVVYHGLHKSIISDRDNQIVAYLYISSTCETVQLPWDLTTAYKPSQVMAKQKGPTESLSKCNVTMSHPRWNIGTSTLVWLHLLSTTLGRSLRRKRLCSWTVADIQKQC